MEIKAYEAPRGTKTLLVMFDETGRIAGWAFAAPMNQWSYRDIGMIRRHIATAGEREVPEDLVPESDKVHHISNRGGRY